MQTEPSEDIRFLGDTLAALTPSQAKAVREYIEDVHGIVANASAEKPIETIVPVFITEEEKKEYFDVVLTGLVAPDKKLSLIKAVRNATGLGLNESKQFVEAVMAGTPKPVKEGQTVADTESLRKALEESGGKVEVK